ncbi:MAG TPA: hypothetical protein VN452_00680 [Longilinea sp.]|nr:hypothetical protein [Longilinea sp.]
MITHRRTGILMGVIAILAVTMACTLPSATPEAGRPTETSTAIGQVMPPAAGGGSGTGSGAGGSAGGSGSGNSGGESGSANRGSSEVTPEPTQLGDISGGPYTVQQIETLGGEAISGTVCSTTKPFSILSVTPKVTFTFNFVPQDAQHGKVTYTYSISSAGESHDAVGTYTLTGVDNAGTLQLSLTVSDHVVFKGFDGKIPNRYKFNLVPSGDPPCPAP